MKFNMSELMEQAKKVQEKMKQSTEDLKKITAEGESGAGMVKALVNGNLELLNLEIEEQILVPSEKEMIENLIIGAVNNAIYTVRQKTETEIGEKAKDMMTGFNFSDLDKD